MPARTCSASGAAGFTRRMIFTTSATSWACSSGRIFSSPARCIRRRSRSGSEVEAEARYNVARLAHHPSLAIWNGCNENIWAYRDWGWKEHDDVNGKTVGQGLLLRPAAEDLQGADADDSVLGGQSVVGRLRCGQRHPAQRRHARQQARLGGVVQWRIIATIASSSRGSARVRRAGPGELFDDRESRPARRHATSARPRCVTARKSGDPSATTPTGKTSASSSAISISPAPPSCLDALDSPDPKAKIPECGCAPLHPAKSLPSKVNFDDLHYLFSVNQCRALTLGVEWFRSPPADLHGHALLAAQRLLARRDQLELHRRRRQAQAAVVCDAAVLRRRARRPFSPTRRAPLFVSMSSTTR